jgi:hypothetical protein
VTLFNGATPPNGFMVRAFVQSSTGTGYGYPAGAACFVTDTNTPLDLGIGFYLIPDANGYSAAFDTPIGYKPIGPVSVLCRSRNATVTITARGW